MVEFFSVVVAGGGPAGAYCAFKIASKGIDVLICDDSHPREKPCGGAISPYVLRKFPLLRRLNLISGVSTKFRITTCDNKQIIANAPKNGFNISRQYFDGEILKLAISSGANLARERVIDVFKEFNHWVIKTSERTIRAKILVGADGVNSLVRRKTVGPISANNLALAFGYRISGLTESYSIIKHLCTMEGYIWVFPQSNCASVGIWSTPSCGNILKPILDNFILSHYGDFKARSKFCAMLPSVREPNFFSIPCAGRDWVLVGDAAGHVNPVTGEGILYAIWSGELAAKAICRKDLLLYERLWRSEYGCSLREWCQNRDLYLVHRQFGDFWKQDRNKAENVHIELSEPKF